MMTTGDTRADAAEWLGANALDVVWDPYETPVAA
jgi:hypothetical protein